MQTHDLKCWPQYFKGVVDGTKPFEIRHNDRNYQVKDVLRLREFDPCKVCGGGGKIFTVFGKELHGCEDCKTLGGTYTGQVAMYEVTSMLGTFDHDALREGYVVMGIKPYVIDGSALVKQPTTATRDLISAALYRMGEWVAKGGRLVQGNAHAYAPNENLLRIRMDMTIARPDSDEKPKVIIQ